MKLLRKTIRKILLENQQYCANLVTMLLTGDIENINQALDLAETLGYVTELQSNISPTGFPFGPDMVHAWDFIASPEFEAEIEEQYDKRPEVSDFNLHPAGTHGAISIRLYADE